jgi:hypothetical protein
MKTEMEINWLRAKIRIQQIKSIGILLIPVTLYLIPVNWINNQHSICIFKNITGHECYGCGITRAVLSAFHFNFHDAFRYNKSVVIILPLLAYIWVKTLNNTIKKTFDL